MTATQPKGLDMTSLTDEQIIALADQHAFDTDKRVLQFARALLSASKPAVQAHCQCSACKDGAIHASDCAVHNAPALPVGECNCGAAAPAQSGEAVAWRAPNLSGNGDMWAYRDADDRFEDQHGKPVGEPLYTHPAAAQLAQTAQSEAVATVKIYETYTGQNGWIEVTQEEYDRTKDKYEHRIRRVVTPSAVVLDDERAAFYIHRQALRNLAAYGDQDTTVIFTYAPNDNYVPVYLNACAASPQPSPTAVVLDDVSRDK